MAEYDKIYDEGWEARISDAKKKDCPYTGKKREVWMDGYEDAGVNFGRGYAESKSKAVMVTNTLSEATMHTWDLKVLIGRQSSLGKYYRELDDSLSSFIKALNEPVDEKNKKSIIRKADDLRNKISNVKTVLNSINLDFILKL